ncbi:MAG: adenosylcobinamide-phosphate synthase CbiB [Oscillospiraceae bacterium]
MELIIALSLGFLLDLIFGDPHWLPHPVRLIGLLIQKTEQYLRKFTNYCPKKERMAGIFLAIIVMSFSFILPLSILWVASLVSLPLKIFIHTIFCYEIFATKCLKKESMRVYTALKSKDIPSARNYLSWIVGRDTQHLDAMKITKAAVETVAENTCDGVIAPLCFMAIGGAPLGFLYKAVNTLDSMVGYKNDSYLNFGRFSARLDDALNFFPAIFSAYLLIISSFILKLDYKNAFYIYKRDRYNHASPNSGKTESVCAGALGIQLAGNSYYFGKLVAKKTIGDATRTIEITDIILVNRLLYTAASMGVTILVFILCLGVILQ